MTHPDPTAAIEVWARMLCAADIHVHDGDHPTWQQLSVAQHGRSQDDYRKAAAWLLPRMTVAPKPAAVSPPADQTDGDFWQRQYQAEHARHVAVVGALVADRAAVLLWAADQIDAETRQAKADGVLEPDKYRPCRDASAQLRRLACPHPLSHNWGCGCPADEALTAELCRLAGEAQQDPAQDGEDDAAPSWSDRCPHCKRWYTTSEPGAHEESCPQRPTTAARPGQPETPLVRCPDAAWTDRPHPPHDWEISPGKTRPCPGVEAGSGQEDGSAPA